MEMRMNTLLKSLLASIGAVGLLAGCASYDYGYGYSQPYYYGYGYDYGPSYYDYGPYYGYYGPGYYVGPPSVGFEFRSRDHDRRDRHERAERRYSENRSSTREQPRRPTVMHAPTPDQRSTIVAQRARVPAAPPPSRPQRAVPQPIDPTLPQFHTGQQ
jgi:hypothetical protein